jgi:BirA family transcriptional regulator, biotin operon repressor / biotin---[acetyl-CoA-carboxylase] ligase
MPHERSSLALLTDWSPAIRARARLGQTIEVHEAIGSTNDRAAELLDEDGGDGIVGVAESQAEGRGRRGRQWVSPPGVNLTLSVALRPALGAGEAWQLGLATALATLEACSRASRADLALKWPNDVVTADDRKVAGLLLETVTSGAGLTGAVLGIGINVNWRRAEMPAEIAERATSLADEAGADVDRVALLDRLLDELDDEITAVEAGRSPLARYRSACVTIGREVTVTTASGLLQGRAVALDEIGSLVVEDAEGRHVLSGGDVASVRGDAR